MKPDMMIRLTQKYVGMVHKEQGKTRIILKKGVVVEIVESIADVIFVLED